MPAGQAAAQRAGEDAKLPATCLGTCRWTGGCAGVAEPPQPRVLPGVVARSIPTQPTLSPTSKRPPLTLTKSWIWGFSAMLGGGCWLTGDCAASACAGAAAPPSPHSSLGCTRSHPRLAPRHGWGRPAVGPWLPGLLPNKGSSQQHPLLLLSTWGGCIPWGFVSASTPPASLTTSPGQCHVLGMALHPAPFTHTRLLHPTWGTRKPIFCHSPARSLPRHHSPGSPELLPTSFQTPHNLAGFSHYFLFKTIIIFTFHLFFSC